MVLPIDAGRALRSGRARGAGRALRPGGAGRASGAGPAAGLWRSRPRAASGLTFEPTTAFLFSCAVPTEFLGSSCVAAQPLVVVAITSAITATAIAGLGRRIFRIGLSSRLLI